MNQTELLNQPEYPEKQRIAALHRYSILDTPPDPRFDKITLTAAETCQVPMSVISFVDEHRQWFKSTLGVAATETPRLFSFCAKTVESGKMVIIPDTKLDIKFADNPLVTQFPFIRFYAGIPLTTQDGYHLGTLCVMDVKPRELTPHQILVLENLARLTFLELDSDLNKTRMKNIETLLRQSSRLASVGELAVGIAHEINNPLAVIQTRVGQLRRSAESGKLTPESAILSAGKIEQVVERINSIVKGLRTFARSGSGDPIQGCTVGAVVADAVFFFEEKLKGSDIEFRIDSLDSFESVRIQGKTVQVCQAVLNLLLNARDAVDDTYSDTHQTKWVKLGFRNGASTVQIRVSDSGPRITPSLEDRIFNPFFTTKGMDRGTGLGLSVSRSLIESFGGQLFLDQTDDEKAFVIELSKT